MQGYRVRGLAPSADAAHTLGKALQIETETVAGHLIARSPPETSTQPELWLVDEASLLSMKDAHDLLHQAVLEQSRVILVGDTRQLAAGIPSKVCKQAVLPLPIWKKVSDNKRRNSKRLRGWFLRARWVRELKGWMRQGV
jgi:ATP-dependent exoDNAse (exonuclease V) alpha subunit